MMGENCIYLDHAAATPVDPRVLAVMRPYFSEKFFNPSGQYAPAVQVKREYAAAKAQLAQLLGVGADELVMTAGATESVNLAFSSFQGMSLVAAIEHDSVLRAAALHGEFRLVQPTKKGRIEPEVVKKMLTPDVGMISIALVNHELGYVQPIEEIARLVMEERERRRVNSEVLPLLFHTDASQAAALLDLKIKRLGVDLLTLSAAKIYGPKQVGLLWVRPGIALRPTIVGGGQERGLRSGTENVAGVIGFAESLNLVAKRRRNEIERLRALRDLLMQKLSAAFPSVIISSDHKKSLVSFLNISFPGIDAERLVFLLESRGVLVATGSACAANSGVKSHVLTAIGLDNSAINGSLRLTLGRLNDEEQIERAAEEIIRAVKIEQERAK